MMIKKIFLLVGTVVLMNLAGRAYAQEAAADSTADSDAYEKIVEESDRSEAGLFDVYYNDEKLYFEVPFELLEKDMLLSSTISEISDNMMGTVGAKPHEPLRVQFARVDSVLLLQKIEKNTVAPEDDPNISNALDKNSMGPVLQKFDIEAYNEDRSAALVDVTNYFISDIEDLSPFGPMSMNISPAYSHEKQFQLSRSFIDTFKSFGDNLSIKSHLSYEYTLKDQSGSTVVKDKPFTAVMNRTLLLLPDEPVRPRIADPRIGIFTTNKQEFSGADQSETVHYARRFHLEPEDPEAYARGELVEPVEPITFYIDSDFPSSWKQTIREAVLDWNKTFEEIGFKGAVQALDYPENDPEFDPDNLKYNVIRYSPIPVQNAMGPSWIDPRSGEILNASVYVYHDIVRLINNWRFIQTAPADPEVRNTQLPEEYKMDGLRYVIRHEVGHTLGFMHNMAGSSSIPVDSLRSPSFTQEHGTTYSIMDYARYNYVAQPGDARRGVKMSPPEFGVYDYYLVDWSYRYFPGEWSKEQVREELRALVDDKAGDDRYRYGMQQGYEMDPTALTEDLGDNAVEASKQGISNLKYVMEHLNEWVGGEDSDYTYREGIWNGIIMQYVRYINHLYANVGGIQLNQKYAGDPRPNFEVAPAEEQRAALELLLSELRDLDWLEDREVLENLPLTGTPEKLLREEITKAVMAAPEKVNLAAQKADEESAYGPAEAMEDIYLSIWAPGGGNESLSKKEKYLQKQHLKQLLTAAGLSSDSGGSPAAFSMNEEAAIALPEFVREYSVEEFGYGIVDKYLSPAGPERHEAVSASFGSLRINFNARPSLESLNYAYVRKVKELLEERLKDAPDMETELHYELLLHNIEQAIS